MQPYGKLVTMIYLKVSLSDFLTLFSARTEVRGRPGLQAVAALHPCRRRCTVTLAACLEHTCKPEGLR